MIKSLEIPKTFMGKPVDGAGEILEKKLERDLQLCYPCNVDLRHALSDSEHHSYNQKEWMELYNKQEGEFKGKKMITAPDLYRAAQEWPEKLLKSLREDMVGPLITGTTILCSEENPSLKIIHNYGSRLASPIEVVVAEIPKISQYMRIENALKDSGLDYVQKLFDTSDNLSKVIETLEKLSLRPAEDIRFMTEEDTKLFNSKSRKGQSWPVSFMFSGRMFYINGTLFSYNVEKRNFGRTRSVLLK